MGSTKLEKKIINCTLKSGLTFRDISRFITSFLFNFVERYLVTLLMSLSYRIIMERIYNYQ
jgi:hypothetical protein